MNDHGPRRGSNHEHEHGPEDLDLRDVLDPSRPAPDLGADGGPALDPRFTDADDPLVILDDKLNRVLHTLDEQTWHQTWADRPALRGWLHAAGLAVAVPTTAVVATRAQRRVTRAAALVFGSSYSAMLAASAAYHRLSRSPRQAQWLRRLDHSMIFVAVAGTYTPVALAVLPRKAAVATVAGAWTAAAAGAASKLRLRPTSGSTAWLYLAFGWGGVVITPFVYRKGGRAPLIALGAGGLAYTLGAGVLAAKKPWPAPRFATYHELWHAFTLAGGAMHAAAIALLLHEDAKAASTTARSRVPTRRRDRSTGVRRARARLRRA